MLPVDTKHILNSCVQKTIIQSTNSATFRLRTFFMIPHLKGNLKIKFKKAQNKFICFCLNWPPRSHLHPSHFRKITWLPARDRVEHCIANTVFKYWSGIALGYIQETPFKNVWKVFKHLSKTYKIHFLTFHFALLVCNTFWFKCLIVLLRLVFWQNDLKLTFPFE